MHILGLPEFGACRFALYYASVASVEPVVEIDHNFRAAPELTAAVISSERPRNRVETFRPTAM